MLRRALVASLLVTAACSGAASTDLFGGASSDAGHTEGGASEGGVPPPPPPPPVIGDAGSDTGPKDAGVVVTEKPAPVCHDLTQHDAFVVATANPGNPPAANPLTTFQPGLYVASAVIEYNTTVTTEPPQKVTADITATRYYYLYDSATQHTVYTTDWSIEKGILTRNILCASVNTGGGGPVKQRIDATPNGYTIYTLSQQGNPLAVRYVRSN
jgi:hypothetical protein